MGNGFFTITMCKSLDKTFTGTNVSKTWTSNNEIGPGDRQTLGYTKGEEYTANIYCFIFRLFWKQNFGQNFIQSSKLKIV